MKPCDYKKESDYRSIINVPKEKYKIIQGHESRHGRICKKEMKFSKYNDYIGIISIKNGSEMKLTQMHIAVFEKLISEAENGNIYVYGRDLLASAGSVSWSLSSLFKRRKNWHEFIESTPKGFYRLNLYVDSYSLKYDKAIRKVKKRKATGQLLNRHGKRFH